MFRYLRNPKNRSVVLFAASAGVASSVVVASVALRLRREELLATLPNACAGPGACGGAGGGAGAGGGGGAGAGVGGGGCDGALSRSPGSLVELVERLALMGDTANVLEELDDIRRWHQKRGFKGGVVLRELARPLFRHTEMPRKTSNDDKDLHEINEVSEKVVGEVDAKKEDVSVVPDSDARHCYYLYYERKSDGQMMQQVFCRGTTLFADVITNLKAVYVYDEELDCYLHMGFRDHATTLLADLEPLLADPDNPRATVEMCGHSLGGVAAIIVALKLRKRGYKVTRLTTFGSPRVCTNSSISGLIDWLPHDTLRVEDEKDGIPLLPLGGGALGDKLWLLGSREGKLENAESFKFVSQDIQRQEVGQWVDSLLYNFYIPEVMMSTNTIHRLVSYETKLNTLASISLKHDTPLEQQQQRNENVKL